jgi:hypothetical protein
LRNTSNLLIASSTKILTNHGPSTRPLTNKFYSSSSNPVVTPDSTKPVFSAYPRFWSPPAFTLGFSISASNLMHRTRPSFMLCIKPSTTNLAECSALALTSLALQLVSSTHRIINARHLSPRDLLLSSFFMRDVDRHAICLPHSRHARLPLFALSIVVRLPMHCLCTLIAHFAMQRRVHLGLPASQSSVILPP